MAALIQHHGQWHKAALNPEVWADIISNYSVSFSFFSSLSICCLCVGERERGARLFWNSAILQSLLCVAFQHAALFLIIHPNMPLIQAPDQTSIFFPNHAFKWKQLRLDEFAWYLKKYQWAYKMPTAMLTTKHMQRSQHIIKTWNTCEKGL